MSSSATSTVRSFGTTDSLCRLAQQRSKCQLVNQINSQPTLLNTWIMDIKHYLVERNVTEYVMHWFLPQNVFEKDVLTVLR